MENNSEEIKNSLKVMPKVFQGFEDYRVIGSILVAAINGKAHRQLHDIDLLIDQKIYDEISHRFQEQGFRKITKNAPGFEWDEFQKENYLTFGVLLKGNFKKEYFEYKPNEFVALTIKNKYLEPTMYELYGEKIRGIPVRSIYEGIKIASLNSKRGIDREIVRKKVATTGGISLNQAFAVKLFGLQIPYLYILFSQVYNLVGGVRQAFGKSYDTWN